MQKILIIVDMQNDFVKGSLGSPEAVAIVPAIVEKIKQFKGTVLFTRDTHEEDYMQTQEGKNLPVPHCIKGTTGWQIVPELEILRKEETIDKVTFGSVKLGKLIQEWDKGEKITVVEFAGVCTDICVISNALLLKAFLPEVEIMVDSACCAGTTEENHKNALYAMKQCQVKIL